METCGVIDRSHHHGTLPVRVSRSDDYLHHCCVFIFSVWYLPCELRSENFDVHVVALRSRAYTFPVTSKSRFDSRLDNFRD